MASTNTDLLPDGLLTFSPLIDQIYTAILNARPSVSGWEERLLPCLRQIVDVRFRPEEPLRSDKLNLLVAHICAGWRDRASMPHMPQTPKPAHEIGTG